MFDVRGSIIYFRHQPVGIITVPESTLRGDVVDLLHQTEASDDGEETVVSELRTEVACLHEKIAELENTVVPAEFADLKTEAGLRQAVTDLANALLRHGG